MPSEASIIRNEWTSRKQLFTRTPPHRPFVPDNGHLRGHHPLLICLKSGCLVCVPAQVCYYTDAVSLKLELHSELDFLPATCQECVCACVWEVPFKTKSVKCLSGVGLRPLEFQFVLAAFILHLNRKNKGSTCDEPCQCWLFICIKPSSSSVSTHYN